VDGEVEYAKGMIWKAPQNASPWNYLGGVMRRADRGYDEERSFAEQFVDLSEGGKGVKSSFAMEFLVECAKERGDVETGVKLLGELRDRYDPIRKGYWTWRIRELEAERKEGGEEGNGKSDEGEKDVDGDTSEKDKETPGAGKGPGGPVLRPKRPGERGHGPVVRV
jgi:hypothetical protein